MWLFYFIFVIILISNYNKGIKQRQKNANKNNYSAQRRYSNGQQAANRNPNPYSDGMVNRYTTNSAQNPLYQHAMNNLYRQINGNMTNFGNPSLNPGETRSVNSYGLPSSARARRKIVEKFNTANNLYLTDANMKAMVDASYMSSFWAKEICFMNQKYENVYAWFSTGNTWLKAYLYVFPTQQITSDPSMQETIVYNTLNQVFSDILSRPNITVSEAIYEINNKYYTQFDDSTFMIAYRFMEQKGKRFPLHFTGAVSGTSDIDNLLSKYEQQRTPLQ